MAKPLQLLAVPGDVAFRIPKVLLGPHLLLRKGVVLVEGVLPRIGHQFVHLHLDLGKLGPDAGVLFPPFLVRTLGAGDGAVDALLLCLEVLNGFLVGGLFCGNLRIYVLFAYGGRQGLAHPVYTLEGGVQVALVGGLFLGKLLAVGVDVAPGDLRNHVLELLQEGVPAGCVLHQIHEGLAAVLPRCEGVVDEVERIRQELEHVLVDPAGHHLVEGFLGADVHAVDEVGGGVSPEYLLNLAGGLDPVLHPGAADGRGAAIHGQLRFHPMVLAGKGAAGGRVDGLELEGLGGLAAVVLAEQQPGEGVENGALAASVGAFNAGVSAGEVILGRADSLEVAHAQFIDFDFHKTCVK